MSLFSYSLHERKDWRLRVIKLIEDLIRQQLSNLYGRIQDRRVLAHIGDVPERQLLGLFREALLQVTRDIDFPSGVQTLVARKRGNRRRRTAKRLGHLSPSSTI